MKISEIIDKLDLKVVVSANLDVDVTDAYASDLLSDVMGKAQAGQVWITMQTHKNVSAIAALKDLPAVIITAGGTPADDMIEHAKSENICVLVSSQQCYRVCGRLFALIQKQCK